MAPGAVLVAPFTSKDTAHYPISLSSQLFLSVHSPPPIWLTFIKPAPSSRHGPLRFPLLIPSPPLSLHLPLTLSFCVQSLPQCGGAMPTRHLQDPY